MYLYDNEYYSKMESYYQNMNIRDEKEKNLMNGKDNEWNVEYDLLSVGKLSFTKSMEKLLACL